jgi:hypothetical protein
MLGFIILGAVTINAARLRFHLDCEKTTEVDGDEVYFVVTVKKSDGTVRGIRLEPSETMYWRMYDQKDNPNDDIHVDLLKFDDLKKGESMAVIVSIMEQDNNMYVYLWSRFAQKLGERIPATQTTTKVTDIADIMTSVFPTITRSDDYIGSFRIDLSFREKDGSTIGEWSPVERSSSGPRSNSFRFDGDNANYSGWGELFLKNDGPA